MFMGTAYMKKIDFFVKRKDSPYPFGWNKEKYGRTN